MPNHVQEKSNRPVSKCQQLPSPLCRIGYTIRFAKTVSAQPGCSGSITKQVTAHKSVLFGIIKTPMTLFMLRDQGFADYSYFIPRNNVMKFYKAQSLTTTHKDQFKRNGEMTRSVMCLLCEPEDLSSDSQSHVKFQCGSNCLQPQHWGCNPVALSSASLVKWVTPGSVGGFSRR